MVPGINQYLHVMKELIIKVAHAICRGNDRDRDLAWEAVKEEYKNRALDFKQYMVFKRHFDRNGYFR